MLGDAVSLSSEFGPDMQSSVPQAVRRKSEWWYAIAATIITIQCALTLYLKQGFFLAAYSNTSYFFLILIAAGMATQNAVRSRQAIRLFWSFLAAGCALWAMCAWLWMYGILRARSIVVPDFSLAAPPLFTHIVLFMAAVVTRPHLKWSSRKLYYTTLHFLLLLFFWVFIYAFLQLPYRHSNIEPLRYAILYFLENLVLVAALGNLVTRAHGPWKTIYLHLFGAFALYASVSAVVNIVYATLGYVTGMSEIPLVIALCWFIWAILTGGKTAHELERTLEPATTDPEYVSLLAMLTVVAIPVIGLWELFRADEPPERRSIRLLITFVAAVLLALSAFIKELLERHDVTADLSAAVLQRTRMEEERLELSGRLIHAQEEERSRIGRELHDDLNQRLGLLAFRLTQLSEKVPNKEENQIIQELWKQTASLSKDVHRLSHELHPSALGPLGLVVAARALCDELSKQQKVNVEFTAVNVPVQLAPELSLCLFRILQESLNNVYKHSHASVAWVRLAGGPDGIRLTVRDNGIGFDPDKRNRGGLGLLSMNERLRLVGGTIRIESISSAGTTVNVWIPINAVEDSGDGSASGQQRSSVKWGRREGDQPRTGTFG
jgi:signal transduction histidine kinase